MKTERYNYGVFVGDAILKYNDDSSNMTLQENLTFIENDNGHSIIWVAKKGEITDGASIPRIFWIYPGSPFTGLYRRAAIIHDSYCKSKSRSCQSIHKMFYNAMMADGVNSVKAWIMYQAVKIGGPKW